MSLTDVVIIVAAMTTLLWIVHKYVPLHWRLKQAIVGLGIIGMGYWVLNVFGVFGPLLVVRL